MGQPCVLRSALLLWGALLLATAQTCGSASCPLSASAEPELFGYEVVAEYPHDADAFTQGLQFDINCPDNRSRNCREVFWESTGQYGESSMRLVHLDSGVVERKVPLDREWFGEGVARLGDRLYQITWLTNTGFIYSVPGLKKLGSFETPLKDGWGITADGKLLVLSDGSDSLTWVDPAQGFRRVRSVRVRDGEVSVAYLNELEMIGGEIWANIWQTECIARICPDSGRVRGWLLLHGLRRSLANRNLGGRSMDVLNGIAYDHARQRLFVTGKYWPRIFEVVPQPANENDPNLQRLRRSCHMSQFG